MSGHNFGWRRQLPDFRDFGYAASPGVLRALPALVDMRPQMPPVYNQTTLGSCTAQAIGADHQSEQIRMELPPTGAAESVAAAIAMSFVPSKLFIYYNERVMEGSVNQDAGADLRDGMKSVANQGVCPESMWPYDVAKFRDKPTPACYIEAMKHQVTSYHAVAQNIDQLKGCLAEGYPFVFGFSVYSSFQTAAVARTGIMPMPSRTDSMLGGHAVMAVGYDDSKRWFIVRNSWGEGWGDKGYFYMPYDYISNPGLAADFWTIRMVEDNDPTPDPTPDPVPTPDPTPDPVPTPDPTPGPCDCSLAFPMLKQFLDAAVVEMNKGATTEQAVAEGLKATQVYASRMAGVRARPK
jgi:hypothetical protein